MGDGLYSNVSSQLLSHREALSLFAQHASGGQNFDVHQILQLHGEDIVKKCGRLPLALRTLGRVFRTKSNHEEWEELLNNEIWNLDHTSEILPALRLSYYDLPPHLKQIFAFCCLFPKDYMFEKHELVLLWMAEGFLDQPTGDKPMEILGDEYFKELVSRSFFQQCSTVYKSKYTMHDLISDLATSVGGEFFFMLDDKTGNYDIFEGLQKVHHLSFIPETRKITKMFKAPPRARRLRTFLAVAVASSIKLPSFHVSNTVLIELPRHLRFLRVLSLANCSIDEVPQSIGDLKHLRYINLSDTSITCLPEQVCNLNNLQSLLLSCCVNLTCLPNCIAKLINLRHLDITNTPKLRKIPLGLTSLQTLSGVTIGGDNENRISDLKGLVHLRGQLSIMGLHEVKDAVHAKEANLQQKKGIRDLWMQWSANHRDETRNKTTEYEVLEGLRPFEKLSRLKISYYGGTKFPSWVGDPTFDCLTELELNGCRSCTCLPTLGQLPSLKRLAVAGMDGLKRLGSEFLRPSNSCHGVAFPSLKYLWFSDMVGWEEWSTSGGDEGEAFPCVRVIFMINCPNLNSVALESIPSLQDLRVQGCSAAVFRSMVGVSSSIATLKMGNIKGLTKLHGEVLEHFKAVEDLEISDCNEMTSLWESEAAACRIFVNLKRLNVRGCKSLVSIGEKDVIMVISMDHLTQVIIRDCSGLKSYNCPNSIKSLSIWNCPSLTSLTFPTTDNLQSSLKALSISGCDNMEVSWLVNTFLSSLEDLYIVGLKTANLRLFPEGCLAYLTRLEICECDNIESIPDNGYGFLPSLCLRYLRIKNCTNLKSFPHEHLQRLCSLKEMHITDCPSMDHSFPCGLWPPNLSSLEIGGLKKPISEWGVQNFPTSLVTLRLNGENSRVVSFAKAEDDTGFYMGFYIWGFTELESLSEGLHHLTCLRELNISKCPKLKDLPETLLPSLLSLVVFHPHLELKKKCSSKKGKYWPIISGIPDNHVS